MKHKSVVVELRWAGFDSVSRASHGWVFPTEVTGADGRYRFWDLPPGEYEVEVDIDTVDDDLESTTAFTFDVELDPGEDYDDGDAGFAPMGEPLPQTGIEAQPLGIWGLTLTLLGVGLLLAANRQDHRGRLRWDRL